MRHRSRFRLRRLAVCGAVGVVVLVSIAAPSSAATHGEKYCEEKLRDAPPGSECEDLGNGNIRFRRGTEEPVTGDDAPATPDVDAIIPSPDRTVDTSPGNRGLVALAFIAGAVGIGLAARRRSPSSRQQHPERAPSSDGEQGASVAVDAPARHVAEVPTVRAAPITDLNVAHVDENDDERWMPPGP